MAARASRIFRRRHGAGGAPSDGGAVLCVGGASAGVGHVPDRSHSNRRRCVHGPGPPVAAAGQSRPLREHRHARGGAAGAWRPRLVRAPAEQSADGVAGRDLLRDLPAARGRHGDRDELGAALAGVHRLDGGAVSRDARVDDPAGLGTASAYGPECETRDDLLVVFVYDVDRGFLRGGRPAVDTDIASQQLRFVVVQSVVG